MAQRRKAGKRPALALLVLGALGPSAGVAAPPRTPAEDRPQLLRPFGADATAPSAEAIERLGRTTTTRAARRLLEWADDGEVRASPRLTLRLVRALDRHARGPLRHEITLRLLSIFRTSELGGAPTSIAAMDRIRGTAARSLARNGDALALRILWAMSAADGELDPKGRQWARQALGRPPVVDRGPPTPAKPAPITRLSELESAPTVEDAIARLRSWLEQPEPVEDDQWRDALARPKPLWTLRALTLRALQERRLSSAAVDAASRHLASADARLRSASAWALAVHAPERAVALVDSPDPIVRRAVLRQSHSGDLGVQARRSLVQRLAGAMPVSDNELSLLSVALEAGSPTPRPAELEIGLARTTRDLPWKTALSSWLGEPGTISRGPDVERVRRWLGADDPSERAACAAGLAQAESPLAAALVAEAYLEEMDPAVRRALVNALRQHPGAGTKRVLEEAAAIDPDATCRGLAADEAIGVGSLSVDYALAAVTVDENDTRSPLRLQRFETLSGRSLFVAADPDGFIGVAREKFAADRSE